MELLVGGILGGILGVLYFYTFEKFNPNSLPEKCWSVLHYLNKSNSPLYLVHLKSITTGLVLIISAIYGLTSVIVFLGSCIIGLHIAQMINEYELIKYGKINN